MRERRAQEPTHPASEPQHHAGRRILRRNRSTTQEPTHLASEKGTGGNVTDAGNVGFYVAFA